MKRILLVSMMLAAVASSNIICALTIKGGWAEFGIQNPDTVISMDQKELLTSNRSKLFYADFREVLDIMLSMRFNTMLTEQAFLCKDGKSGEMFADLTIGYDPCTEQVFAEVKDEVGKLHRVLAGKVRKGEWNDVRVNAVHDKQRHESTLTLTVKNEPTGKTESTSATYPGYALRYDVTRWVVGHGFPGNSPNSLQVRRGDIKGLAISGEAKARVPGQNPIFTDQFTADPACTVIGNRIYAYVGVDKAGVGGWFNMPYWVAYSSDDMIHWTNHGIVLRADDFPNARSSSAWAAQVVEHGGKYYYYVTLDNADDGKHKIDVAVSDSPTGPFFPVHKAGEKPIVTDDMTDSHRPNADIDPTMLIDNDGQAYIAWGNGDCYMAKLKKNMTEIDGEVWHVGLRNYSEGPWLFKRQGIYYLVYAADAPGVQPEQMAYAMATDIRGPWKYGGLLTSCAKYGFTIHPSVNEFKGRWYLFYHDGSYMLNGEPGGDCRRQVCVEEMHFNADGTIQPITLTEEGVSALYQKSLEQKAGHRVTVDGKIWTERQGWNRDYMLSLDVDRLLVGFRQQAHLDTKGAVLYGGWESTELRGHTLGHWLTAMSLYVSQTDDAAAASRLTYVVHSLAECQTVIGTGFLSAWDERMLDNVEDTGQGWAPYYTIHKILQGLIDAYTYTHNAEALTVAECLGDYLAARAEYIKARNEDSAFVEKPGRQARVSWEQALEIQETGGYPEAMLNLYALIHNDRYLSTARLFHQMSKLIPASKGIDELHTGEEHNHHHANTTIPQFIAAARDAQLKGDETLLKAAKNFWEMVVRHRTYSIGSTGHHEHWNLPPDRIIDELTPQAGETCATYNMIRLSNLLFSMGPRAEYAEYVERALCNHILSSIQPQTANFMYFHTVKPGTPRTYGSNKDIFWCCTGSGMENPGRYAESIYFEDTANNRLYVNQFIGSTMEGVVHLDSEFPAAEEATMTLLCDTTMDISIRRPSWSKGFKIRGAKGKEQDGYVTISRQWKKGDKLRIFFPMDERKEYVLGSNEVYSILHGPLVMAAKTDETPLLPEEVTLTDNFFGSVPERYDSKMEIPIYTRSQSLIPLYQLGNYRFTIYWK